MKKKKAPIAVGIVLLLAAGAWALGLLGGADPEVAALDQERRRVFSGEATDEERQEFRDRVGRLSDDQRRQLFDRGRPEMRQRMAERMNELFELPPEELAQEVSDRVDDILEGRADRDESDRGGGRWASMTAEQRDAFRKQMLDRVDPSTRAQFSELRRLIDNELEARGQDPMQGRDYRSLFRRGR